MAYRADAAERDRQMAALSALADLMGELGDERSPHVVAHMRAYVEVDPSAEPAQCIQPA